MVETGFYHQVPGFSWRVVAKMTSKPAPSDVALGSAQGCLGNSGFAAVVMLGWIGFEGVVVPFVWKKTYLLNPHFGEVAWKEKQIRCCSASWA